ncbi:DUF998 domain-containing protein [Simiduia agarivorans]|uniref:DUF998 domain-containing protein n=1 Tax=Simiduia agarivorans (strain DSM 21679 / JCM 13881 / BCRC 17597 / SA1) TaxID=1117647 RepID=K4L2B2_SIMAS|nr:DUF998 domain-containing protein [Simiduia agarivorans]AFV00323.1 hypothetical protein M5M_15950 [Simiduia agarivorans SA1 = DSM 21679]
METILALSGLIACIWLCIGIVIAARFYPGYSHLKQFCSELGADGSPTQRLSPIINNYPLGALFIAFGCYVLGSQPAYPSWIIIGAMIIVHGVGTWIAGYFPMDSDPYIKHPTRIGTVHATAGAVMLMSLLIAPLAAMFSDTVPLWFRWISALSVIGCITFTVTLASAYQNKTKPGLHQRISYGFQLAWLALLSLELAV